MTGELLALPASEHADVIEPLLAGVHPEIVAHSHRSHQFAAALAVADGADVDHEVLYLGTVLHDVGLAPAGPGAERFEIRGANDVRTLLLDRGMERDRVADVWDVIAMHASTPLARHKSPQTRYANLGIALDVRGQGADALDPAFIRAVLDRWPRAGFPAAMEAVLAEEVRSQPHSVRMSWLESVALTHLPGFTPTDFLAGLRASSGFA